MPLKKKKIEKEKSTFKSGGWTGNIKTQDPPGSHPPRVQHVMAKLEGRRRAASGPINQGGGGVEKGGLSPPISLEPRQHSPEPRPGDGKLLKAVGEKTRMVLAWRGADRRVLPTGG